MWIPIQNPWSIGVAGAGIVSVATVFFIVFFVAGPLRRRRNAAKHLGLINAANDEVIRTLKPYIAQQGFPDKEIIDAIVISTARKYKVSCREMYSVRIICEELGREIIENVYLTSARKQECATSLKNYLADLDAAKERMSTKSADMEERSMFEDYEPREVGRHFWARELCDWIEAGILTFVCVVLVFTFVARLAGVDGASMLPTLEHNDRLVITRLGGDPAQGDIVVVNNPDRQSEPLVKRVIATQGQMIDIDFTIGAVFVDGYELYEPYISEATTVNYDMHFPQIVPEGHIFIMGDNRNNSLDSRDLRVGMVDNRDVLGRAIYRVFPAQRVGIPR